MNFIGKPFRTVCLSAIVAAVMAEANNPHKKCRTRFTLSRPAPENVVSLLFGVQKGGCEECDDSTKLSFNHDDVGITKPIASTNPFPSCVGYPKKKERFLTFHNQLETAVSNDNTLCSSTYLNGWRILRFQARVGYGEQCYRRLQNAVFDWDFEAQKGKKSMGIVSAAMKRSNGSASNPRKNLLATFTEVCFPAPLKSLFVVNPVHVVYEVRDARSAPKYIFSSTSYATLSGHLLAGEERVAAVWRKGMGSEVDIEIVSFSKAAPSIGGKLIWPLIGRMQKQFFLSEVDHLVKVGRAKL